MSKGLRDSIGITGVWEEDLVMAAKCPHCNAQIGALATSCWNCKLPLNSHHSRLKEVDYEEREETKNLGRLLIVPLLTVAILVIILVLAIAFGGELYLLILLVYVGVMVFGLLLRKSRKAERIMRLNRMNLWGDDPIYAPRSRVLVNIFTAQKLREWEIEKSELVKDGILIVFSFVLWIFLMMVPHHQGPLFYWWKLFSPWVELFAIYVLFPVFLVIIIMIYYNDTKIYKSRQFRL